MMQLTILSSPDQITEHGTTFSVSHLLWGTKHAPAVTGSIGYVQEDGFYVEMICEESDPLRRYEGLYAPVYLDSAMEAFFHFPFVGKRKSEPSPYLNLEFNANGASLCGDFWKVHFRLPLSLLKKIYGITGFQPEDCFSCNFYKISEDPDIEHYSAFSPVLTTTPDFHRPEYFAPVSF